MKKNDLFGLIFIAIIAIGITLIVYELKSLLTISNYIMQTSNFVLGFGVLGIGVGALVLNETSKIIIKGIGFLELLLGVILVIVSFLVN